MNIRAEMHSDIEQIEQLVYRAFENHPHHAPGAKPTEHIIVNKLRQAEALSLSLVCEDETGIIGHIAFSPVSINSEKTNWYGLGPVSVVPERQGEGIGGALIRQGLSQLKEQNAQGVVLLGEPEYYRRFEFECLPQLTLTGVPAEYFMALAFGKEIAEGEVTYHPAFFEAE